MHPHIWKTDAGASKFCYAASIMVSKPSAAVVEAWARLVRTERRLRDKVEEALKSARLPPLDWYHVLHEVERAPKGMLRQTGVQDRTQLAQYNVCRLVDRLEGEGLVERRQCQLDGRNNVLVITARGKALRHKMWPVYATAIEGHVGAHLSQAEAEQLARLLGKLLQSETGST
jgi:DNA-binding MarR family transcriptional regulator